ncbi:glycosyltransferase [Cellulomonas soli]|uniref:glycosyltransferase n=1 Tax=Cellulomonas soli TaxID=931535 RepID=UPI003F85DD46
MSRILVTLSPLAGHVRPALPVIRALADAGHDVLVYTGSKFADAVADAGGTAALMVRGRDIDDAHLDAWSQAQGAPSTGLRRLQWDVRHVFLDPVPDYVDDLTDLVASFAPHVVLAESAFLAGALTAARHDLPCVALSVVPLALTGRDTAPFGTGLPPTATALGRARTTALRLLVEKVAFRDAQRHARAVMAEFGMAHPRGFLLDWVSQLAACTLHTSVPGLEHPRSDLPASVEMIGPIAPREAERFERPAWWQDVLAACTVRRPVVLVTQGAVARDPQRLVLPALAALADEDVLVVALAPAAGAGRGIVAADVPGNARVTEAVPFDQLLPFVDVLVTHGGFGGVQQALVHGVPVVVAGRSGVEVEVAARVVRAGAGVSVRTDARSGAPSPAAVQAGVRAVLGSRQPGVHARALAVEYGRYDAIARTVEVVEATALRHGRSHVAPVGAGARRRAA